VAGLEWQSCLERPNARVHDLILGPPSGQARLVDQMEEAARQLGAEQAADRQADVELKALQNPAIWVLDMVLEQADGLSSLVVLLSSAAELLEGHIDVVAANEIRWGTRSVLVPPYRTS
jgi:hypothetical protein